MTGRAISSVTRPPPPDCPCSGRSVEALDQRDVLFDQQRPEQPGDERAGRVLDVGVQEDEQVAGGRRHPGRHRLALAAAARRHA